MTPFHLAPLALLLVALPASAQSPVFEVRDASGATLHFAVNDDGTVTCTDCISGAEIADGTIEPEDINGGLFNGHSRDRLYLRSQPRSIFSSGAVLTATTTCDSVDDIPITGSCYTQSSQNVLLRWFGPVDWEDPALAAGYTCTYQSMTASTVTFQARIYCLSVPDDGTAVTRETAALDLGPARTDDL